MATNIQDRRAPGATQPFVTLNPAPVIANRPPTIFDNYETSTIWIQQVNTNGNPVNEIWILASVQNGQANWIQIEAGGDDTFDNLFLPNTNHGGTVGVIYFNNVPFFQNYDPITPGNSVFIGQDAGNFVMTSPFGGNVGIGSSALHNITTGGHLTAVGEGAGASLTTGVNCTFIGQAAGISASTGSYNTVVGCQSYNGTEELPTGSNNSILGAETGSSLTTGENNTLIGYSVAAELTSGGSNTVISGGAALSNLISGSGNIIIGAASGNNYTGAESNNVLIGSVGVLGESNVCRIGQDGGGILHTYIAGEVSTEEYMLAGTNCGANGDSGASSDTSVEITNTVAPGVSTGTMTVLSANTNNGQSSGYIKFYYHGGPVYVPFFANIEPA